MLSNFFFNNQQYIIEALPCTVTEIDLSFINISLNGELKHLPISLEKLSLLFTKGNELVGAKVSNLTKLVGIIKPSRDFPNPYPNPLPTSLVDLTLQNRYLKKPFSFDS